MTNPLGKGTKNLTINVSSELHAALTKLAEDSEITLSEYCRRVLSAAKDDGLTFETRAVKKKTQT